MASISINFSDDRYPQITSMPKKKMVMDLFLSWLNNFYFLVLLSHQKSFLPAPWIALLWEHIISFLKNCSCGWVRSLCFSHVLKPNLLSTCVLIINELFKLKTFFGWEVTVSVREHKIAFVLVSQSICQMWELRLSIKIIHKIVEKEIPYKMLHIPLFIASFSVYSFTPFCWYCMKVVQYSLCHYEWVSEH